MAYRCEQPNCGAELTRPWNLKRHNLQMHGLPTTIFKHATAKDFTPSVRDFHPATHNYTSAAQDHISAAHECPSSAQDYNVAADGHISVAPDHTSRPVPESAAEASFPWIWDKLPEGLDWLSTYPNYQTDRSIDSSFDLLKKRKASFSTDRILRARQSQPAPKYEVKQSKTTPGQQKAIDWLKHSAKKSFDQIFETIVARWGGVKPTHQGTCVLCPED